MAIVTTRSERWYLRLVAGQTRTTSASLSIGSHRSSLISIVAQIYNIHLTCITEDTFFSFTVDRLRARAPWHLCLLANGDNRPSITFKALSIHKTSFRFSHFSLSRCEISHRVAARDNHLPHGQGNRIAYWPTKEIGKGTRKCYEGRNGPRDKRTQTFSCGVLEGCTLRVYVCMCVGIRMRVCVGVGVRVCAGASDLRICTCVHVCRRDISFL